MQDDMYEMCEHDKGSIYDGVKCEWIMGNIWFNECSWVNVPADTEAGVFDPGQLMTMESYVEVGEKIYDLAAETGHMTITESAARLLGVAGGRGGDDGMELTKEQIEALQAEVDQAKADKITFEAEKVALETEKDALKARIAEVETLKVELEQSKLTLETEKIVLEQKIVVLQSEVETLRTEKIIAMDELIAAKQESRTNLIATIVDMEASVTGDKDTREAVIEKLSARSTDSLKDKFTDLVESLVRSGKSSVLPGTVHRPVGEEGIGDHSENQDREEDFGKMLKEAFVPNKNKR